MDTTSIAGQDTIAAALLRSLELGPKDAQFDAEWYLDVYPDARAAVDRGEFIDALQHYLCIGHAEQRRPNRYFADDDFIARIRKLKVRDYACGFHLYLAALKELNGSAAPLSGRLRCTMRRFGGGGAIQKFDPDAYRVNNKGAQTLVDEGRFTDLFQHYLVDGAERGRRPNRWFDERAYLDTYPDVARAVDAGVFACGFHHFVLHGAAERRRPGVPVARVLFDLSFFEDKNEVWRSCHAAVLDLALAVSAVMPWIQFDLVAYPSTFERLRDWAQPNCRCVEIPDGFTGSLTAIIDQEPNLVVSVFEPSWFRTEVARSVAILSDISKQDITERAGKPALFHRLAGQSRIFVLQDKAPRPFAPYSEIVIPVGKGRRSGAGLATDGVLSVETVAPVHTQTLPASGIAAFLEGLLKALDEPPTPAEGLYRIARDGWVSQYAGFVWNSSEEERVLRLSVELPRSTNLSEVDLRFIHLANREMLAVERVEAGETRILRVPLPREAGVARINMSTAAKIILDERWRTFRSVRFGSARIEPVEQTPLFVSQPTADVLHHAEQDALLARTNRIIDDELIDAQADLDASYAVLVAKYPAFGLMKRPVVRPKPLQRPKVLLLAGCQIDDPTDPLDDLVKGARALMHYFAARGFAVHVVDLPFEDPNFYNAVRDRKVDEYEACVLCGPADPRVFRYLRDRFPSVRRLFYGRRAEFLSGRAELSARSEYLGASTWRTGLDWIRVLYRTRKEIACARLAHTVYAGNDWEGYNYWPLLLGSSHRVRNLPKFLSDRYYGHASPDQSHVRTQRCVCVVPKDAGPLADALIAGIVELAIAAGENGMGWRFEILGDFDEARQRLECAGAQLPSMITWRDDVTDTRAMLPQARALALVSEHHFDATYQVIDALQAGCHALVTPATFNHPPVEVRDGCVIVDLKSTSSVNRAMAQCLAPPAPTNANRRLMARMFASLDDEFGFSRSRGV